MVKNKNLKLGLICLEEWKEIVVLIIKKWMNMKLRKKRILLLSKKVNKRRN